MLTGDSDSDEDTKYKIGDVKPPAEKKSIPERKPVIKPKPQVKARPKPEIKPKVENKPKPAPMKKSQTATVKKSGSCIGDSSDDEVKGIYLFTLIT